MADCLRFKPDVCVISDPDGYAAELQAYAIHAASPADEMIRSRVAAETELHIALSALSETVDMLADILEVPVTLSAGDGLFDITEQVDALADKVAALKQKRRRADVDQVLDFNRGGAR
jgi:hypothetical protein